MDYKENLKIDESALDLECLDQPSLMMKYGELLSEAKYERDSAKEQMEVIRAEIDLDIRKNPEKYGLEKLTEGAVSSCILLQSRHKEAVNNYLEARRVAENLTTAVNSVEQRKSMLEALVKLHGQQYFAGPRVPRDIIAEREEKQRQVDSGVGKCLKRKKPKNR